MLNLFKIPFRVKSRNARQADLSSDFSTGLLSNFMKHNKGLSGEELDKACKTASAEMAALQRQLNKSGAADKYDLMAAALRRIERDLNH